MFPKSEGTMLPGSGTRFQVLDSLLDSDAGPKSLDLRAIAVHYLNSFAWYPWGVDRDFKIAQRQIYANVIAPMVLDGLLTESLRPVSDSIPGWKALVWTPTLLGTALYLNELTPYPPPICRH